MADRGLTGATGLRGERGLQGFKGDTGAQGIQGNSAYEVAVANGFVGTEAAWLTSIKTSGIGMPCDFSFSCNGVPSASTVIGTAVILRKLTFDFASSFAKATVAPTVATVLNIALDGASVGTITFAANSLVGIFSATATNVTLPKVLTVSTPAALNSLSTVAIGIKAIYVA